MQVSNCHIKIRSNVNKHTREAIVALAKALQANATAISEVSRALQGGPVSGIVMNAAPTTKE